MILLSVPETITATDVLVLGVSSGWEENGEPRAELDTVPAAVLPVATAETVAAFLDGESTMPAPGELAVLPLPGAIPMQVWIAGLGTRTPDELRIAAVAIGRAVRELDEARTVAIALDVPQPADSRALAEGLVLGGYEFGEQFRSGAESGEALHTVQLVGELDSDGLSAGDLAADAAGWARDLGNTPASELTPEELGRRAIDQLTAAGCTVEVHDEQWLAERGFGGILAVGAGSASPPRLIEASYRPRRPRGATGALKHVVLVGKGITFDTGGLNLKPAGAMRMMHTDMCGGAAVLAALHFAATRGLPLRVTVLVPAAENAVSGTSMRPSDIIRQYGGRSTEIGNTDAEGRLVLADALAYAVARLRPDAVIDIATLTGAMKVALGLETAGYFANDDDLAGLLDRAAGDTGEALWRMPLDHGYQSLLDSSVADARNDPGNPGGITAALFLQPFVAALPWAHLDIAGPARALEEGPVFSRGATGYGARLLARYLELVAG